MDSKPTCMRKQVVLSNEGSCRGTVLQFMLSGDFDSPLESHKVGMAPSRTERSVLLLCDRVSRWPNGYDVSWLTVFTDSGSEV